MAGLRSKWKSKNLMRESKLKVGILTFHDGLNHGAYLQAYCTMRAVERLGHDAVIINYKNREHWLKEDVRPWMAYRRPVRFLDHWQKRKAFKKDQKQMNLTPFTKDPEEVRARHFDAVIFGSDVVWDTKIFGYDSLYFGDLNADRRIGYAASCGSDDFSEEIPAKIQQRLRTFDQLSVRDQNTESFVERAIGLRPSRVLDPVFLPEGLSQITNETNSSNLPGVPFILVYGSHHSAEDAAVIRTFAKQRGLAIFSVGCRNLWADRSFLSIGPLEILSWFKKAQFVFSSTFHGCIFAIRCEKDFGVLLHGTIHNKVTSLLDVTGLQERGATQLSELISAVTAPVDYSSVNARLLPLQEFSRNWLASALQDCEFRL